MIRVLQKTATLGPGGIQKFLIDIQTNLDENNVCFDYFLNTQEPNFFTETVKKLGSRIYGRNRNTGNMFSKLWKRYVLFYRTLKKEKYEIVHIDETLQMTAVSAVVAKLAGTRVIIAHSHNDHASEKLPWYEKKIINPICRRLISANATDYFACSEIAAKWLFTKKLNCSGKIKIINNGIQPELYEYDNAIEEAYRMKLGLGDSFVLGHVGRFYFQKNHKFIIETFAEIHKKRSNAKLVLVGEGELRSEMEEYAKELGIYENIIFYGVSNEVNKIMQTFDAFIFPSHYEGLGIVAIESQAASVHTFCAAETIAKEVDITEFCHYISLNAGAAVWAEQILKIAENYDKRSTRRDIINANFDIVTISKILENFYLSKR